MDASTVSDPLLASALHDPLMVDPDLAYRNEANAALTVGVGHALPVLEHSSEAERMAREKGRLELLASGRIADLPAAVPGEDGRSIAGKRSSAIDMALVYDAPEECVERLVEGYSWAASMPVPASIMPHGQVSQAAGADQDSCKLRVVRYVSAAGSEDTLQYHYNRAVRARLDASIFDAPERSLNASNRNSALGVHVRERPEGGAFVDLIYWSR
ncbi:MAG: hypothetical protein AAGK02_16330 [Pseudomonadota bacterium]